jgi:uncharacterized membrane protein
VSDTRPPQALVFALSAALLVAVLLAVLTMAHYEALLAQAQDACTSVAAPLDLSSWVPLCKAVR